MRLSIKIGLIMFILLFITQVSYALATGGPKLPGAEGPKQVSVIERLPFLLFSSGSFGTLSAIIVWGAKSD